MWLTAEDTGGGHADLARASSEGSYQPASLGKKLLENQVTSDLFISSISYFNTNKVQQKAASRQCSTTLMY